MRKVSKYLGVEVPEYLTETDPTRKASLQDWSIMKEDLDQAKKLYDLYCKNYKKRKLEIEKFWSGKTKCEDVKQLKQLPHPEEVLKQETDSNETKIESTHDSKESH